MRAEFRSQGSVLAWQLAVGLALLVAWEIAGQLTGSSWISRPSLVALKLSDWLTGELWPHLWVTLVEMFTGLAIGVSTGSLAGLWLGRSPIVATILRPMILAIYSVPLISLAPLLILWFGIDLAPKIVLVTLLVFFILFFNTYSGVQAVDAELIASTQLMGATSRELFAKIVVPACMAWIMSGIKTALPYALIGAILGEMLAARQGIGFLITRAAAQFDMTGLYAAFVVLMVVGISTARLFARIENRALRWRHASA
jgi:NitT/TauT family transport system permease protein